MSEKKKMRSPGRVISDVWFAVKYTFKYTPGYIAVSMTEGIGRGFWHIIQVIFIGYLFNSVEAGIEFKTVAFWLLMYTLYNAAFELFNKWRLQVYVPRAKIILHKGIQSELYQKARELDQRSYDDPEFYNDFVWAIRESDVRVVEIMDHIGMIVNRIICSFVVWGMLATMDLPVALILLAAVGLGFVVKTKTVKIQHELNEKLNPIRRKISYVERVFTLPDFAKEIRQGSISEHMLSENHRAYEAYADNLKKTRGKRYFLRFCSNMLMWILPQVGITGYIVLRYILDAAFTLGSLSASITASFKLFWTLDDISNYINRFNEHSLYIERVRKFTECKPEIVGDEKSVPDFESLEIKNISFTYPFSKRGEKVLDNVSLRVNRGEKIAFVGYNGAGKTTLTKLIMRLYDCGEGEILYNGRNIRDFAPEAYRGHLGAVFQDYKVFAATVAENVMGGEFSPEDEERVLSALKAASFEDRLSELPKGIHSQLTTEFSDEGVGLSGGESQKIAIARVFARPFELIIMDEPSSALDPIAEYELNRSILENARDRTVIFISHRLSTTRMADRIYMFDSGRIIETGSHEELMRLGGKYAQMFNVQAKKYRAEQ